MLAPLGEHLVHRQAGHAFAKGRLGCSLKVMSGRQQGLSPRWRRGAVVISPGRLDFTPEQGWPRATRAITHLVVLGPSRPPSMEELTRLPTGWLITELQTPAATLGWAVPARDRRWALDHLQDPLVDGSSGAQPETLGGSGSEHEFPHAARGSRDRLGHARIRLRPSDASGDQRRCVRGCRRPSCPVHRRCCSRSCSGAISLGSLSHDPRPACGHASLRHLGSSDRE